MVKLHTIRIIVLCGFVSCIIFSRHACAQTQTSEKNWEQWYQTSMVYIDASKAILSKHGYIVNEGVKAIHGLKQIATVTQEEKKKHIDALTAEAQRLLPQFQDEFLQIKPPAEFELYKIYFQKALIAQQKEIEAAVKGQDTKPYSCEFISLLLKATEELQRIFIAHHSPQGYIDSHAELIKELNQSLQDCK